jgi:hypothetical protein
VWSLVAADGRVDVKAAGAASYALGHGRAAASGKRACRASLLLQRGETLDSMAEPELSAACTARPIPSPRRHHAPIAMSHQRYSTRKLATTLAAK